MTLIWVIEPEPEDDDFGHFYYQSEPIDDDWYIQNEPTEDFQTNDHFYFEVDETVDLNWYIQNEPTEGDFDQFYFQGEPTDYDYFYFIDDFQSSSEFYILAGEDLFGPNDEFFFYFIVEQEIEDDGGFIMQSEFDPGRHDWRNPIDRTTDPLSQFLHVSEAVEGMMIDLADLKLTPEEIQTDQDDWTLQDDEQ